MPETAWNPGLSSRIPSSLQSSVTLFRPENSIVDYRNAKELSDFCGLKPAELISFRIERLIIHDLLIRVTADLSVPDGPNYEDLGISLRSMVNTIYTEYVLPDIEIFQQAFDKARGNCERTIKKELSENLYSPVTKTTDASGQSLFSRLTKSLKKENKTTEDKISRELLALEHWQRCINSESDSLTRCCVQSVYRVVSALVAQHGRMVNELELTTRLAVNMALNRYGSELAHTIVQPLFRTAVEKEKYRWLPVQEYPVVMNVKGASASGKSTIRPQQRQLAGKLGIPWEDYALISPDYWRKYLLDYDSLGADYKYAAMLTGQELEIVDKKLDNYMADKAAKGHVTHLLIDRFRFDSFNVGNGGDSRDSRLLSRFGDRIFLYFMITPPAETVVRAWERGKTTGRFKAVDDLLYHNIEAYTGMPDLFLSWVLLEDKQIHFEFLDNSVEKGQVPKTAAFGKNNAMTILDVDLMRAIEQYKKVNVDAKSADSVFTICDISHNNEFLNRCLNTIAEVTFVDAATDAIYATVRDGELISWDRKLVEQRSDNEFLKALFGSLGKTLDSIPSRTGSFTDAAEKKHHTLGHW